jgi:hypothetical protein
MLVGQLILARQGILARTSQEEGLAPAYRIPDQRGQAPLPDLF